MSFNRQKIAQETSSFAGKLGKTTFQKSSDILDKIKAKEMASKACIFSLYNEFYLIIFEIYK